MKVFLVHEYGYILARSAIKKPTPLFGGVGIVQLF